MYLFLNSSRLIPYLSLSLPLNQTNCKTKTDADAVFKRARQKRGDQYRVVGTNLCLQKLGRRGTKISASANGKVVYAGSALTGYGKLIIINHNDDYLSAYAHNDTILVKEQQYIKAGETIAKMGDTDAERVMLHFEVRFRGKSVDPLKYLPKQ